MSGPSLVQSATPNKAASASSLTLTFGSAVTAGNTVVAFIAVGSSSGTVYTVSTVKSGTSADNWAVAVSKNQSSTGNADAEIWVDSNAAGGNTTVVITLSATATEVIGWAEEWSGLYGSSAVDKTSTGNASGSETWTSNATATLSQASEVAFGLVAYFFGGTLTITAPGAPWTELTQESESSQCYAAAAYQVVSATTALTYNGTANGFGSWCAVIATLKAETLVTDTDVSVSADASTRAAPQDTDVSQAADSGVTVKLSTPDTSQAADTSLLVTLSAPDSSQAQESNGKVVNAIDSDSGSAADATGTLDAYPADTDGSQAADSGTPGPRGTEASTAAESSGTVGPHDHDASGPENEGTPQTRVSSAETSAAADTAQVTHPSADASLAAEGTPGVRLSSVTDGSAASDGGELINGHHLIFDTEPVRGTDSGFSAVSDSDSSSAADSGTPSVRTGLQSDASAVTDLERKSWPSDADFSMARDLETISRPHDTESGTASDSATRTDLQAADASHGTDAAPVVYIYTYQPSFRWDGGGYEVILTHPLHGARVFWTGPSVTRQALELAAAYWVADYDDCRSVSAEDTAMEVTVSARPALQVFMSARAVVTS